jgi:ankyrin repeat protein
LRDIFVSGRSKMLKYLLEERGANVNAIDHEGRTPLFSGAYDGNNRALKIFCECGADLSHKDKNGITALDLAVRKHEFESVLKKAGCR